MRLLRVACLWLSGLSACSMAELGPGEGEDAVSKSAADLTWATSDLDRDGLLWTHAATSWSAGAFVKPLPQFPRTGFAWPDTSPAVLLANEHDWPLLIQGEASYRCADGVSESQQRLGLGQPAALPGANAPLLLREHSSLGLPLACAPIASKISLLYRAVAPEGAVAFHDAAEIAAKDSSFSTDHLVRLDVGTEVARSALLDVAGKARATLYIRYSRPESDGASAVVKVGIQNGADGATLRAFGKVKFPTTAASTSWDQWNVATVKFAPGKASSVYARLQLKNGQAVVVDSAWVR